MKKTRMRIDSFEIADICPYIMFKEGILQNLSMTPAFPIHTRVRRQQHLDQSLSHLGAIK
jgi:hypothetical protein